MYDMKNSEIDQLYSDVAAYRKSDQFRKMLDAVAGFIGLAPYNAMIAYIQRPGSIFVASACDWKRKYHRSIKPEANPIVILKPFGPVDFVYEYNDTEGEPLPESLIAPDIDTEVTDFQLNALIENVKTDGIDVHFGKYGTEFFGKIERNSDEKILVACCSGKKKCRVRSYYTIVVNDNLSAGSKFTTILHELGHLYCGHLYHDCKAEKWLPDRFYLGLSDEEMEFEAETVSWIVCRRLGIKNPSEKYLAGYVQDNDEIPWVSVDTIMKAAGVIEKFAGIGMVKYRKELLIKTEEK